MRVISPMSRGGIASVRGGEAYALGCVVVHGCAVGDGCVRL